MRMTSTEEIISFLSIDQSKNVKCQSNCSITCCIFPPAPKATYLSRSPTLIKSKTSNILFSSIEWCLLRACNISFLKLYLMLLNCQATIIKRRFCKLLCSSLSELSINIISTYDETYYQYIELDKDLDCIRKEYLNISPFLQHRKSQTKIKIFYSKRYQVIKETVQQIYPNGA